MEQILKKLFDFLISNRHYNQTVQENFYKSAILPYKTVEEKVIALLYDIANTQSQPNINKLADFFKFINETPNCLQNFSSLIDKISPQKGKTYNNLYQGLRNQSGWENKTSALFTKTIYHLHNGDYQSNLRVWDDTPATISKFDDFFLPVDAVIIAIFKRLIPNKNWNFNNITKKLKEYYKGKEIEVWDDLWFWGFITQNGTGENRKFEWNENKYWMLKESDKNKDIIREIKEKSEQFLKIILENAE